MTTLVERTRILRDSTRDPTGLTGTELTQVQNARTFRDRIRAALVDVIEDAMPMGSDPDTLANSLSTARQRDLAMWSQKVLGSVDAYAGYMLDILLAQFEGASEAAVFAGNSNPADGNAGDDALKAAILNRRAALAFKSAYGGR